MEGINNPNKLQTENIAEVQMELFIHGTRLNRTVRDSWDWDIVFCLFCTTQNQISLIQSTDIAVSALESFMNTGKALDSLFLYVLLWQQDLTNLQLYDRLREE